MLLTYTIFFLVIYKLYSIWQSLLLYTAFIIYIMLITNCIHIPMIILYKINLGFRSFKSLLLFFRLFSRFILFFLLRLRFFSWYFLFFGLSLILVILVHIWADFYNFILLYINVFKGLLKIYLRYLYLFLT